MKRYAFATALLVTTAAMAQTALPGVDKAYMDPSVKPGDNFDTYANGGWRKTAEIPADRSSIGVGLDVSLRAEARTAAIIKGAAATKGAPGSDQQRIADYYAAYTDTNGIEARGLTPIQASLSAIAAIKDKSDLSRAIGAAMRSDTDPFNNNNYASTNDLFGLFVSQDLNQPTRNVPYLMQGGLGLPDRDYYLSDKPEMAEIRTAYQAYLTQLMQLAGLSDPQARAARVFALETKIAAAQTDIIASQDAHKGDNPWTRADFDKRAPGWTGRLSGRRRAFPPGSATSSRGSRTRSPSCPRWSPASRCKAGRTGWPSTRSIRSRASCPRRSTTPRSAFTAAP